MSNQLHDLVVLSFSFATHTPHVRNVVAEGSDDGRRMHGPGYPLNGHGMSADRLNQFNLMYSVRKNQQTLTAVTVVRRQDVAKQSQIFFRRVEKAQARLKAKAQRIAELKKQGNTRRAVVVREHADGWSKHECTFLDVKVGDRFHIMEQDGTPVGEHAWIAKSNGFWSAGYIACVRVEPA